MNNKRQVQDKQTKMSAIDFNDESQVSKLRKLMEAITVNQINATFVGQPFYNDEENDFDEESVYIELSDVNGVREGEQLYMYVNSHEMLLYQLHDADGKPISEPYESSTCILDYTTCRDGICVFGGCEICNEEE